MAEVYDATVLGVPVKVKVTDRENGRYVGTIVCPLCKDDLIEPYKTTGRKAKNGVIAKFKTHLGRFHKKAVQRKG